MAENEKELGRFLCDGEHRKNRRVEQLQSRLRSFPFVEACGSAPGTSLRERNASTT